MVKNIGRKIDEEEDEYGFIFEKTGKDYKSYEMSNCLDKYIKLCKNTGGTIKQICGKRGQLAVCDPYGTICLCSNKKWDFEKGCV